MGRLAGRSLPPAVVARVHEVTGGNPLFVGELVRALVADGRLVETEGQVTDPLLRIPEELRGLLHRRLAGLSTEAVANLKVASVIGRDFELLVLRRISRLSVGRLSEALAESERAGIVSEDPSAPGRYSFSHELLRESLYDDIPAARRLKLHHTTGLALEEAFLDDLKPHLAELAHHFIQSAPLGDGTRAVGTRPGPVTGRRRSSPTRTRPGTTPRPCTCCPCWRTAAGTGAGSCCCVLATCSGGPGRASRPAGASRRRPPPPAGWARPSRWLGRPSATSPAPLPSCGSGWAGWC